MKMIDKVSLSCKLILNKQTTYDGFFYKGCSCLVSIEGGGQPAEKAPERRINPRAEKVTVRQ